MIRELRPHQGKALAMLRESLTAGWRRPMLQLPTGAGKTVIAAAIVEGALRKGNRVVFVVPALSLIDQTVSAFWAEGLREVGVIQASHPNTNPAMPVQVASVQTLERRQLPACDVAVVDEAHRWFKFFGPWFAAAAHPIIGLSATPWARGLGRHYDDLLIAATTEDLIDNGYLSPFRVFAPSHPDLSGVRTVAGDFHEGDLGEAMNKPQLVADVVTTWLERAENRPTLAFAVDRAHAKRLQAEFQGSGVAAGYVDAFTDREERVAIAAAFKRGDVRVVVNVGTLTTGVDWDVRCIVLARPTRSEMLFTQIVGRGLRTAEGKVDCLILDHSDTHLRLGFVTDIRHDRLDDGKAKTRRDREREEPLPKECPSCSFLRPAKVAKCPACGFNPEVKSAIECEDGELIELDGDGRRKAGKAKAPATQADKQRWYSMLLHVARERGHKGGWAAHKYRSKFGVWPRGLSEQAIPATGDVLGFVRSQQIAWVKGRQAAERGGASARTSG